MEYRLLGRSGCVVSVAALGTMTFGAEAREEDAHAQLDRFVEAGGTLIDTADVYSGGASEEIVGRWLVRQPPVVRGAIVLGTKGRFSTGPGHNAGGLSRRHLQDALDASLRRLGVDHVHLYQLHAYDPLTPLDETLRFLDDAVRAGKIQYIGLSNFTGWQTQRAVSIAERHSWTAPVSSQPQYSLLAREVEWEVIPAAVANGLGILPWSPLGGGWLTGKYSRAAPPTGATRLGENPDRGMEAYDRRSRVDRTWDVIDAVDRIATRRGVPMSQVALAWLADRPGVTSVILGARSLDQLEENLGAVGLQLDTDETHLLDQASDPGAADYPYGRPGQDQRDRSIAPQ
jgi:aryl-alcohol dehydrogenase-like predicted oxidoreductase